MRDEKGSVIVIVYMRISERNNNQKKKKKKIQEEYQSENIDQVYQETLQKEGLNQ